MTPVRLLTMIISPVIALGAAFFRLLRSLPRYELQVGGIDGRANVRVIDGDTVLTPTGERLRLYGIDAPERSSRAGRTAAHHLRQLLDTVDITYRIFGRDHHGRPLVVLYVHGQDINERLIENGHARAYGRYTGRYKAAERRARKARHGNWSDGFFPHPESTRRA